jgi:hypothetical protein
LFSQRQIVLKAAQIAFEEEFVILEAKRYIGIKRRIRFYADLEPKIKKKI